MRSSCRGTRVRSNLCRIELRAMRLVFEEEQVVKPKRIAKQYLSDDVSPTQHRSVLIDRDTFNVKNYNYLRLPYKVALADIVYKDQPAGIEAALCLQCIVDAASEDRGYLPLFTSQQKKVLNRVTMEQESQLKEQAKKELESNERLARRKLELQKILNQNPDKLKLSKEHRQEMINRSANNTINNSQSLRTKSYLEDLKKRSVEIKKMKVEVQQKYEQETRQKKEGLFFMKKKQGNDFTNEKAKHYSEVFEETKRKRQEIALENKQKVEFEHKIKPEKLRRAFNYHHTAVNTHKESIEKQEELRGECRLILDEDENTEAAYQAFEKYRKMQDVWTVLNDPVVSQMVSNKLITKLFVDAKITPEVLPLKRAMELIGRSSKVQENAQAMTFDEFKTLFCDFAIDSSKGLRPDPAFTRSRVTPSLNTSQGQLNTLQQTTQNKTFTSPDIQLRTENNTTLQEDSPTRNDENPNQSKIITGTSMRVSRLPSTNNKSSKGNTSRLFTVNISHPDPVLATKNLEKMLVILKKFNEGK